MSCLGGMITNFTLSFVFKSGVKYLYMENAVVYPCNELNHLFDLASSKVGEGEWREVWVALVTVHKGVCI